MKCQDLFYLKNKKKIIKKKKMLSAEVVIGTLRRWESLGRFSAILYKGGSLCNFLFCYVLLCWTPNSFWKEASLKGKNLLPEGANSKFFPFRVENLRHGVN